MEAYKSKFTEAGLPSKISSSPLKLQGEALLKLITQFNDNLERFKTEIFYNTSEGESFNSGNFRVFERWLQDNIPNSLGTENSLRELVNKIK